MAHDKFQVEVLTPEGEVFNEEVEMLSTRTEAGSIGVLAHHAPVLALLAPTELRLYRTESEVVRFAQGEGYIQIAENRALVLVEEATPPEELDPATLRDRLADAEKAYGDAEAGSEEQRRCARDKRRWETFLEIAGADSS